MTNFKKSDVIVHAPYRLRIEDSAERAADNTIGLQVRNGANVTLTTDLIGAEIMPRFGNSYGTSKSLIGLHVAPLLNGTTGNITGDMRAAQFEIVDAAGFGGSSRTISGDVCHLRVRSNINATISGKYSVFQIALHEGVRAIDYLFDVKSAASGFVVAAAVGGLQSHKLKINIGGTDYYIPLNTA